MVADSTQSDSENKKKKHKSVGKKEKKSKKDRRRRRRSSSSSYSSRSRSYSRSYTRSRSRSYSRSHSRSRSRSRSRSDVRSDGEYDSDVDLKKELKPLNAYLRQPPELLDQMLHSVRGSSLQRALPDVLKTMPLEELRKRCLEYLAAMSRKRIKRILAGDDPATISSSGTEDDESTDEEKQKDEGSQAGVGSSSDAEKESHDAKTGSKIDDNPADSPLSLHGAEVDMEHEVDEAADDHLLHPDEPGQHRPQEYDYEEEMEEGEHVDYEEGEEVGEEEDWDLEGGGGEAADVADVLFPEVEQDKMELLELEMRARAIKAMLAMHEQRDKKK